MSTLNCTHSDCLGETCTKSHASCQQEIAALKRENAEFRAACDRELRLSLAMESERDSLKAECERMKGALEFYADPVNWRLIVTAGNETFTATELDVGEKARAALAPAQKKEPAPCHYCKRADGHDAWCAGREKFSTPAAQKPIREFKDMNDEEFNAFGLEQRCGKQVCGEEENNDGCVFVPCPKPPHHLEPCAPSDACRCGSSMCSECNPFPGIE